MKKFLLFFSISLCGALIASTQTTYEIGEGKSYTKNTAPRTDLKTSTDTEFILNGTNIASFDISTCRTVQHPLLIK